MKIPNSLSETAENSGASRHRAWRLPVVFLLVGGLLGAVTGVWLGASGVTEKILRNLGITWFSPAIVQPVAKTEISVPAELQKTLGSSGLTARTAAGLPYKINGYQEFQKPDKDFYRSEMMLQAYEVGDITVDEQGIRYFKRILQREYRPVTIAQYALWKLALYQEQQNSKDLAAARANLDWLKENSTVNQQGERWFPYDYRFALAAKDSNTINPQWYSAMAQGQILSLVSRMYQVTGDAAYRQMADEVFLTLQTQWGETSPWATLVDQAGYLWFEEYAGNTQPLRVINGHGFATFGLLDYWWMLEKENSESNSARLGEVTSLIDGGVTTLRERFTEYRVAGEGSLYCLEPQSCSAWHTDKYHEIAIQQLEYLAEITADNRLGQQAEVLRQDYRWGKKPGTFFTGW